MLDFMWGMNMDIKKIVLTASVALFAAGVSAQDDQAQDINQNEAPQAVVETFEQEFAAAEDVNWEKKGDTYEAEFELKGEEKEAHISESGELEMTSTQINRNELPQEVNQTLKQDYADYDFQEFSKVEKDGETKYKVKAEKDGQSEKLMFDSSGEKIEKDKKKHKG